MVVWCYGWRGRDASASSSISLRWSSSSGSSCKVVPSFSTRHGGGGDELGAALCDHCFDCPGVMMRLNHGEHSWCPSIWRPTLTTIWWSAMLAMQAGCSSTSKRRPSSELVTAFPFLSAPSGSIPGAGEDGRGSSLTRLLLPILG
jgi:hypothetical protein